MGMYTELIFKARLIDDAPEEVVNIVNFLFSGKLAPKHLPTPDHKFFNCPRWTQVGNSSSFYHIPIASSVVYDNYIFSRSDLKNYDNEIELFLDWINPYLDNFTGDCIGWTWYEEDMAPTLIYK